MNSDIFTNPLDKTTADALDCSRELKDKFTRASSKFTLVIQEMEKELERLKSKGVKEDFISMKDQQIDRLVSFHNEVEQLLNHYDQVFLMIKIQNRILESAIDSHLSDAEFRKSFLTANQKPQ